MPTTTIARDVPRQRAVYAEDRSTSRTCKPIACLIAGPPGFGKTSALRSHARSVASALKAKVLWIPGGIVASEKHLSRLLRAATGIDAGASASLKDVCRNLVGSGRRFILAIDDFDVLTFKREPISAAVAKLAVSKRIHLLATTRPESVDRLASRGHVFADALLGYGEIVVRTLAPLNDTQALALIQRRAPRFPRTHANTVIAEAGGHPAALVYLSRLAVVRPDTAASEILRFAAEFAGAIYAEGWSALGPQQRAIVWELSRTCVSSTAAAIADALDVPASQVSSQLSRLVNEGFVLRAEERAQFTVTPLLARWIKRRVGESSLVVEDAP